MKASELEYLWQKQQPIELTPEKIGRITAIANEVDRGFRRKILWRDLREIGAALIMAAVLALLGKTWLRWVAVASCLFVVAWIIRSRIMARPSREMPSVIERLQQMIRETEIQIRMGRSLFWWYLLPCAVAMAAMLLDCPPRDLSSSRLLFLVGPVIPLFLGIYWLNQWAVRKKLVPRRDRLRHALEELSQHS